MINISQEVNKTILFFPEESEKISSTGWQTSAAATSARDPDRAPDDVASGAQTQSVAAAEEESKKKPIRITLKVKRKSSGSPGSSDQLSDDAFADASAGSKRIRCVPWPNTGQVAIFTVPDLRSANVVLTTCF